MIEMLVAVSILLIALIAAAFMFQSGMKVSGDTRQRVVAAHLATQQLEAVRGPAADPAKFKSVVSDHAGQEIFDVTVNGIDFRITQDIQFVSQTSNSSSCDGGSITNGLIAQVTERVTWSNMGATQPVQVTTALSPPVGAYSQTSGGFAVKVVNAQGQPMPNIDVQIVGPVVDTIATTTEGCAFFAYVPPGSYTASVIDGTGVGDQGELTPSISKPVLVGQIASHVFNYDMAATIDHAGWSISGGATVPATGLPISVANNGLQPYFAYSFAPGTTSMTPLYPYTSGYTLFAGNCADNNPIGKDGAKNLFYPGLSPTPVGVTAGGSTSAAIELFTLPVAVTSGGLPVPNATVTATTTDFPTGSPNIPICTDGGSSGSPSTIGLVSTDAAGNSLTGVPLGHWSITATSGPLSNATPVNIWVTPTGVYDVTSSGAQTGPPLTSVSVVIN
jgi:Tfp pilus assembly protein PilV